MADKKLHHIEVHPGKNGGHKVVHEYERMPSKREGAMSGGMYMERPAAEEHLFGPEGSEAAVMSHIASALGFKSESEGKGKKATAEAKENY